MHVFFAGLYILRKYSQVKNNKQKISDQLTPPNKENRLVISNKKS